MKVTLRGTAMIHIPTVREIAHETVMPLFLSPELDIYEALAILSGGKLSCAPVLTADGRLMGILTEKDCLRVLSSAAYGALLPGLVRDFMSPVRATLTPDMDLFVAAMQFTQTNFSALPILDGDRFVGMLARQNMLTGIQLLQREVTRERKSIFEQGHAFDAKQSMLAAGYIPPNNLPSNFRPLNP